MQAMHVSSADIFARFQAGGILTEKHGPDRDVSGIAPIESCGPGDLVFIGKAKFLEGALERQPAAAVIDPATFAGLAEPPPFALLVAPNVNLAHALIKQAYMDRDLRNTEWGRVHPSAVVHESVQVPADAVIGPLAVIGRNVRLGKNVVVMANAVIEHDAQLGDNVVVHPGAVVGYGCIIGDNCILKSGCIIGGEGFGFAQDQGRHHHRIPQTGIVRIGKNCVIGGNNTIDRATYGETVIGDGCIFDTLVHVAHNVEVGEDCIFVSMVGVAGSTRIGKRVILSGQCGVLDHLTIADDVVLLHRPAVTQSVEKAGVYAGQPLIPVTDYMKNMALLKKLADMKRTVDRLEKKVGQLEGGGASS